MNENISGSLNFAARLLVRIAALAALPLVEESLALEPAEATSEIKAGVYLKGEDAGRYREETRYRADGVTDYIEQLYIFNRVGSRVEISTKETYEQDANGRLKSGHFESSASRTTVVTDVSVQNGTLQITTKSGSGNYVRNVPLDGELLGPEGLRRLLTTTAAPQTVHYKTFIPSLGAITEVTLKCLGHQMLSARDRSLATIEAELSVNGVPGVGKLWVDESGHTIRLLQDSPLGQIEVARNDYKSAEPIAAANPSESYDSTLAVSNIRLPHPRKIAAVTVELTKKAGAQSGWPEFSSDTQRIVERTSDRVVIAVSQAKSDFMTPGTSHSDPAFEKPNALVQSDDPEVQRLAQEIVGGQTDPWKKAIALQRWVAMNMHFDAGIAIAPASELVRDRHGTCMGYSTLLAALARAAKIPSRMKLGYVYDGGSWGGHAWTEVLINGNWVAIDAAEYFPGVADAARISVIATSGENGTIDHIGDVALLYGKVEIRTLAYTLGGQEIHVGRNDKDYVVDKDIYSNRHLNLRVTKPKEMTFKDLDTHWPSRGVVTIAQADRSATILYARANPNLSLREEAANFLPELPPQEWEHASWKNIPAVRALGQKKQAIVARRDDVLWGIVTSGDHAASLLEQMKRVTEIGDFAAAGGPKPVAGTGSDAQGSMDNVNMVSN